MQRLLLWFDVGIKRYTTKGVTTPSGYELWFDVGIKRYTTPTEAIKRLKELWFDVGIKRYTTDRMIKAYEKGLWFDVGIKRYTTSMSPLRIKSCCGLMQESKDIQQSRKNDSGWLVVV